MKPMFGFRNTFIYDAEGNPCYKTWSMGAFVDRVAGKLKYAGTSHGNNEAQLDRQASQSVRHYRSQGRDYPCDD